MKTIIQDIGIGKKSYEFKVRKNEEVTLVLLGKPKSDRQVNVTVRLIGAGSNAQIIGFFMGKGDAALTLHTLQSHEAPNTTSNLLVKSVLSENAKFFYDGGIRVEKKAQITDAYQRNENLILSRSAHAESKPSLEILANDVRCTHGATTGTINNEQLWYLTTRGIKANEAKQLLVRGFLESALSRVSDTIQDKVRRHLWQTA